MGKSAGSIFCAVTQPVSSGCFGHLTNVMQCVLPAAPSSTLQHQFIVSPGGCITLVSPRVFPLNTFQCQIRFSFLRIDVIIFSLTGGKYVNFTHLNTSRWLMEKMYSFCNELSPSSQVPFEGFGLLGQHQSYSLVLYIGGGVPFQTLGFFQHHVRVSDRDQLYNVYIVESAHSLHVTFVDLPRSHGCGWICKQCDN